MSVLKGEDGTHVILYGSTAYPARARSVPCYLARPDLAGSYTAVLVVPPAEGITSSLKDLCRRLARHGLAALVPDLYRGSGPGRRASAEEVAAAVGQLTDRRVLADLDGAADFLRRPGTEWADPHRLGVLGIGTGGRWAVLAAAGDPSLRAVVLAYAPLAGALDAVGELTVPLLGLYGKDDEEAIADVPEAHRRHPGSEWAMYDGVGSGFLDDAGDAYDPAAAKDAEGRLVAFFAARLAAPGVPAQAT